MRFARDSAARLAGRVLASLCQAAFLVVLARVLGVNSFGVMSIALGVTYVVNSFLSFGFTARAYRLAAESDAHLLGVGMGRWRSWSSLLAGGFGAIFSVGLGADWVLALLVACWSFSDNLTDYAQAHFAGESRHLRGSILILAQRALPLSAMGLAVWNVDLALCGAGASLAIVGVLAGARYFDARLKSTSRADTFRNSRGYWLSTIVAGLTQLQTPLVGAISSPSFAALFAASARLTNPLTLLPSAMQGVATPELSKAVGTSRIRRLALIFVASAVAYALILSLGSPIIAEVALLVLGPEFSAGGQLFVAMTISAGLIGISQMTQSVLFALGRPEASAYIVGVGNSVGLALLLLVGLIAGSSWVWICPIASQALIAIGMLIMTGRSLR